MIPQIGRHSIFQGALLILIVASAYAHVVSEDRKEGLYFSHNNGALGSRGQLFIPASGSLKVDASFSCSFDLSFWDPTIFGYLVTVIDPSGFVARLTFFPRPLSPDSADIVLSVNFEPTSISVPLASNALHRGRWFPVELLVDPGQGVLKVWFAGKAVGEEHMKLPSRMNPAIIFGHTPGGVEVPPIAIKNVSISVPDDGENSQRVVHSWPLKEEEGETVADQVGGVEAAQYNCLWLAGRQRQWMPETRIPMDPLDPVVFDKSRSRILLVGKSALTIFRLSDGTKSRVQYRSPRPLRNDQVKGTYDDAMDCILVYHNGTGQVSIYSDSSRTWTPIDTTTAQDQHYYAHATFSDPVNGALYAMGGYGWYTAKNTVQMYLFADQRWEPVAIAGSDRFAPRYSTVVAPGDSSHLWYVFGGHGNSSGRQEAGFHALRDLWLLDLQKKVWVKRCDSLGVDPDFYPFGLVRAGQFGNLLLLGGFLRADTSAVELLTISPDSGTVRKLTEIPNDLRMLEFPLFAFDQKRGDIVIGVIRPENPRLTALEVYTRPYPPPATIETASIGGLSGGDVKQLLLAIGLAATLGLALWVYRRRHQRTEWRNYWGESVARDVLLAPKDPAPQPMELQHAGATEIRLFGSFRLLDSSRRDRATEFSPKILELFLLIATHSHAEQGKNAGIAVPKLTSILWPHSSKESSKNSRGVALKALRDLLAEIGGIHILRQTDHLVLELDRGVHLDLFSLHRLLARLEEAPADETSEPLLSELLGILEAGPLLETCQYTWLAEMRESLRRKTSRGLLKALPWFYTSTNFRLGLRVADRYLIGDPLNETALRVKLHALAAEGHHGEAAEVFASFATRYAEVFQRPFPRALKDLLI